MEIKDIKALLVNENEVTNEMILEGYLIGVIRKGGLAVHIVKNRFNGVEGLVPFSMWVQLTEDLEELKQKAQVEADKILKEEFDDTEDETLDEIFDEMTDVFNSVFGGLGKSFDEIRPKAEKVAEDVSEKLESNVSIFLKNLEEIIQDIKPRVQEVQEQVKTEADKVAAKGINGAVRAKLITQRAKLQKMLEWSIEENIATKGYIKKAKAKIAKIEAILAQ